MYSALPIQSSVVFESVAATSSPSFHKTAPVSFNPFDGRCSTFIDESVDYTDSEILQSSAPQNVVAALTARSGNSRSDCFAVSPRTTAAERSTPLKPAKRDRTADDDDCRILRCKRSLASSLKTAATSCLDGGTQQPPSSTFAASESVERRNLRERRRVKLINVTFATLRNRLPSYCWQQQQRDHDDHHHHQQQQHRRDRRQRDGDGCGTAGHGSTKRPSKVDTLKTAINYIRCLQDLLADDDRQRMAALQTFNTAATDTVVSGHHWATSPATMTGYDTCSPVTSMQSSPSDDLTPPSATMTGALAFTRTNNNPDFTDELLESEVSVSPLPDILDWLI